MKILTVSDEACPALWDYYVPGRLEEYDLIIPDHAWDTPQVQQMIATLKSEEFKNKILSLGGYTVENPGEIIPLN